MTSQILWFRASFGDSRLYEFSCVAEQMLGYSLCWCWDEEIQLLDGGDIGPNLVQKLPPLTGQEIQILANAAQRTMACKGIFSVLAEGSSKEECLKMLQKNPPIAFSEHLNGPWCFRFAQIGKGNRFSPNTRREIVETFGQVISKLHEYPVQIENPEHELYFVEDHRRPMGVSSMKKQHAPRHVWLFYKHNHNPNIAHIREWEDRLALTKRAFLSATTMEASRSLQLANMAVEGDGSGKTLVDPFCGSGSLLLAATALGASCVGSDKQHYLLLRHERRLAIPASKGRENRGDEKVSFFTNFTEQKLPEPTILSSLDIFSDEAVSKLLEANKGQPFDCVLTDPPYGLRASKTESTHELLKRLFFVSNQLTKSEGLLVFLFPEEANVHEIPNLVVQHEIYSLAKEFSFQIQNLGWERFQQNNIRMIAVLKNIGE